MLNSTLSKIVSVHEVRKALKDYYEARRTLEDIRRRSPDSPRYRGAIEAAHQAELALVQAIVNVVGIV